MKKSILLLITGILIGLFVGINVGLTISFLKQSQKPQKVEVKMVRDANYYSQW